MQTIVIGHKNPDMDAIVSAISYAEYKRLLGWKNVIAARAGAINERVAFALRKFGIEEPPFLGDLSPRVEDVMERNVIRTYADSPITDALERIGENRFRGLPVTDRENHCVGILSSFKISRYLFPPASMRTRAREVHASLADICSTFGGRPRTGKLCTEVRDYRLVVAAMNPDTFAERVRQMDDPEKTVLFVGDRSDIIGLAIGLGVRAIVLTSGLHLPEDAIASAQAAGVVLIESPLDTATSVLLSRSAVQARQLLDDSFVFFRPETLLEEARLKVATSSEFAFPVIDENQKLVGILSKSDFLRPMPRQLILVDHNELAHAVNGADEIPIIEILDHHRICTLTTDRPILFVNRPVGSTSTIVASFYQMSRLEIPKPIAGLLMCGLISDTLNLTSPTTTEEDREIMKYLEAITGINPTDLAAEIFSVGSPLQTMEPASALHVDLKQYEDHGRVFTVSQIEEVSFTRFFEVENSLREALRKHREANGLFFAAALVTDVNEQNSILLVDGDASFISLIDYPEIRPGMWRLDGVVSRKVQLIPYLSNLLARISS
jgi:manganese-dependent inorganic pyrophosphatase